MIASRQHVLVLDDDRDFCELVEAFLEGAADVDCVAVHSLEELVLRSEDALGCALALLDVNLGPGEPSGLDALDWLRAKSFGGRTVFLTGHARGHPRLRLEVETAGLSVLEKPVDAATLLSLVEAL